VNRYSKHRGRSPLASSGCFAP